MIQPRESNILHLQGRPYQCHHCSLSRVLPGGCRFKLCLGSSQELCWLRLLRRWTVQCFSQVLWPHPHLAFWDFPAGFRLLLQWGQWVASAAVNSLLLMGACSLVSEPTEWAKTRIFHTRKKMALHLRLICFIEFHMIYKSQMNINKRQQRKHSDTLIQDIETVHIKPDLKIQKSYSNCKGKNY